MQQVFYQLYGLTNIEKFKEQKSYLNFSTKNNKWHVMRLPMYLYDDDRLADCRMFFFEKIEDVLMNIQKRSKLENKGLLGFLKI